MPVAKESSPKENMKIYDHYESLVKHYKQLYGDHTIVAYQKGEFYQIFCADDGLVDLYQIADDLNISLTRQNKSNPVIDRSNYRMIGFPVASAKRYMEMIIKKNYTLVMVDQYKKTEEEKKKGGHECERKVSRVLSKGTVIPDLLMEDDADSGGQRITFGNTDDGKQGNYIYCIYVDFHGRPYKEATYAVAIIDVSTGFTHAFEIYPREEDPSYAIDELVRIRFQFSPLEVILVSCEKKNDKEYEAVIQQLSEYVIQELKLKSCLFINHLGKMPTKFHNVHFHNAALDNVFPAEVRGMLSPIEYANLELKQSSSVAFVYLITYLKGHNEILVEKLQPIPLEVIHGEEENMILSHNTANQLDLDAGLQTWVNKCQTAMGKRYLSHRLLNPSYNVDTLAQSYRHIRFFLDTLGVDKVDKHRRAMTGMMDLERLLRMMELNTCRVQHMAFFYKSMRALQSILMDEKDEPHFARDTHYLAVKPALEEILFWLESVFTVVDDEGTINDSDQVSFKSGVSTSLDCLTAKMTETDALLDDIVADINKMAGNTPIFKKEVNEREGQYLTCTNKRWEEAKKKPELLAYVHKSGAFAFSDLKKCASNTAQNATKISCDLFQDSLRVCRACAFDIERETRQLLTAHIHDFLQNFKTSFRDIVQTVREMDFHMTAAFIAFKYRFTCPKIDADAEKPFIIAENLRHPIVERIQQDITYVGNDVCIGHEPTGKGNQGMLLYGLNAAGKSTLMKSLALAVILAQAGFYVPASSFHFHPYRSLFSRITRGDDINRGQSTFTIEMQELRNILRRSDSHSLIIGDEVCSGTETASAIAIVSAGLHHMIHKNDATFIFATHYHDLTSVPLVKALYTAQDEGASRLRPPLGIFHLHVEYDPVTQKLIYDRTLKPGQGRTTYGIEVCRALNLDASFIEMANKVRQEYTARGHKSAMTHVQESRYNPNFYSPAQTCTVCGKKEKDEDYHVHHIHYQKDADKHGYIKTFHKNQLSNLVLLCEACHDKVHRDEIFIKGWTTSSHGGRELIVTETP